MRKIYLLDCTLRDGGYINDWRFGRETIKGFCKKIARTGIEILEVGFIKRDPYDPDQSLFPDVQSFTDSAEKRKHDVCGNARYERTHSAGSAGTLRWKFS